MLKVLRSICLALMFIWFAPASAEAPVEPSQEERQIALGGEVPWPLSNQRPVTAENAAGLWRLDVDEYSMLFNVEMISYGQGVDWIRVSELDKNTLEVITWGEGFFKSTEIGSTESSYSSILLGDSMGASDRIGRYIYMFPNGDIQQRPYLVRLVEVETSVGSVLGMSVIKFSDSTLKHMLARRVLAKPLPCHQHPSLKESLRCYFEHP